MSKCVECGSELMSGAKYCTECGVEVIVTKDNIRCTSCGEENAKGVSFCSNCGKKLKQERKRRASSKSRSKTNKSKSASKTRTRKQKRRSGGWVTAILALALGAGAWYWWSGSDSAEYPPYVSETYVDNFPDADNDIITTNPELEKAKKEYQDAFEKYTKLATTDGEGDLTSALEDYRRKYNRYKQMQTGGMTNSEDIFQVRNF